MLTKIKLKQGTLAWEKLKAARIGSSEIFDIVRYYASDEELQNCGINAESFREEKPYTTAWALYHKLLNDGFYKKEELAPEYAQYGHAAEPYGVYILQKDRARKLKPGRVYAKDRLIASLDIDGIAEECDFLHGFDYGCGKPIQGQHFVCEQKTMNPIVIKKGLPLKYIVQAQYQIWATNADFFILQVMILNEDTPFIRGKICQMSKKKRFEYLDENMKVINYYFKNNEHLSRLIEVCIERFFNAVDNREEPTPFIECDLQQNIIESIRLNTFYNDEFVVDYDLADYLNAKKKEEIYGAIRKNELQKIVEKAKKENACRFKSKDGTTSCFSKNGRFLIKEAAE